MIDTTQQHPEETKQPASKKVWHKPTLNILQASNTMGGAIPNNPETFTIGPFKGKGIVPPS